MNFVFKAILTAVVFVGLAVVNGIGLVVASVLLVIAKTNKDVAKFLRNLMH